MTDTGPDSESSRPATTRRSALKKAAIAAGAVAWATPTIQALTPGVASAQVRVTNCRPDVTWSLVPTGGAVLFSGCVCAGTPWYCCRPDAPYNTHLLTYTATSCGAACPGTPTFVGTPTLSGVGVGVPPPIFGIGTCVGTNIWALNPCTGTKSVTFTASVRCPDNVIYPFTQTRTITCGTCAGLVAAATPDEIQAAMLGEAPALDQLQAPGELTDELSTDITVEPTDSSSTTTSTTATAPADISTTSTTSTTSTSSTTTSTTTTPAEQPAAAP